MRARRLTSLPLSCPSSGFLCPCLCVCVCCNVKCRVQYFVALLLTAGCILLLPLGSYLKLNREKLDNKVVVMIGVLMVFGVFIGVASTVQAVNQMAGKAHAEHSVASKG